MRREHSRDPANDAIPPGLRIGAAFAWRLLVIAAAIGVVLTLAWVLSDVVVPFLIGVILAALLVPLSAFLQRHRCPKWLAIIIAWIVLLGVGAWLLGVPLATPIAVIVFFGALVPILGSIVAGAAAVLIAFLFNGLDHALIMLGVVLLVNQLEGNVLHPFLTGGVVKVHPLGVVVGVIAGAAVGGVAGAFLAVPIIATANAMINAAADYSSGENSREAPVADNKATP
ncbi:MAG: hypothetical protein OJF61_001277 [Rhodanobacteraceae bacterium]|jgi:predicted PurR-regulated permease PerM|nr:MAG: hypothetical protein OJF61_001277 [Rhodanobacteraceae bacterium]